MAQHTIDCVIEHEPEPVMVPVPRVHKVRQDRPYQNKIHKKSTAALLDGVSSVLIEAPTGAGKTFMGLRLCHWISENFEALADSHPEFEGLDLSEIGFVWLAMRDFLLVQAIGDNEDLIGCPNFITMSVFANNYMAAVAPYKALVFVVDEAQHAACSTCVTKINEMKPVIYIGLSATPIRTDKTELCFQKTIRDAGYHRLIQDGWLSKFDYYSFTGDYTPESVARTYLLSPKHWGKSVIFFLTEKECKACAAILAAAGIRVDIVTGKTNKGAQIAKLENNELDVLINMVCLTEGFDMCSLNTVFVRDSENRLPTTQMAGRVLRLFEALPIKNIVQSERTGYPFTKVAGAHRQFLESFESGSHQWLAIGASDEVERTVERLQTSMNGFIPNIPEFLQQGKVVKKKDDEGNVTKTKESTKLSYGF